MNFECAKYNFEEDCKMYLRWIIEKKSNNIEDWYNISCRYEKILEGECKMVLYIFGAREYDEVINILNKSYRDPIRNLL